MDYIIEILSLALSFAAFILVFKFRNELALPEQISNLPEFLIKEYIDREFKTPIKIGSTEYLSLREVRGYLQRQLINDESGEYLKKFKENTMIDGTWENSIASEFSVALQNVGLMVLAGVIPPALLLTNMAYRIIDDWRYCSSFVTKRRQNTPISKTHGIRYHRRHAEWLCYAAIIYMSKSWEGEELNKILNEFDSINKIKEEERKLRSEDKLLVPRGVLRQIEKILE